jgi:hypothetical protein
MEIDALTCRVTIRFGRDLRKLLILCPLRPSVQILLPFLGSFRLWLIGILLFAFCSFNCSAELTATVYPGYVVLNSQAPLWQALSSECTKVRPVKSNPKDRCAQAEKNRHHGKP